MSAERMSVDGTLSLNDAIDGVVDLFPSADRQALQCLGELLCKKATSPGAAGDTAPMLWNALQIANAFRAYMSAAPWGRGKEETWLGRETGRLIGTLPAPPDAAAAAELAWEPAPAAEQGARERTLLAAMHEAKSLLSYAGQDSVDPAIGQANKNRAWHVLDEALRSAAP